MIHIREWFTSCESHKYSNACAVYLLCETDQSGAILDKYGIPFFTLEEFCDDMCQVESLKGKPKLLMLQTCSGLSVQNNEICYVWAIWNSTHDHKFDTRCICFLAYRCWWRQRWERKSCSSRQSWHLGCSQQNQILQVILVFTHTAWRETKYQFGVLVTCRVSLLVLLALWSKQIKAEADFVFFVFLQFVQGDRIWVCGRVLEVSTEAVQKHFSARHSGRGSENFADTCTTQGQFD